MRYSRILTSKVMERPWFTSVDKEPPDWSSPAWNRDDAQVASQRRDCSGQGRYQLVETAY